MADSAKELGRATATVVAKKTEHTRIVGIELPKAYAALGRDIHSRKAYREELAELYTQLEGLFARLGQIETLAQERPRGSTFGEKAKAVGEAARDKTEVQAHRLQVARLMAILGRSAFEKHGNQCGPNELVSEIERLAARATQLETEIKAVTRSSLTPRRLAVVGALSAAALLLLLLVVGAFLPGASDTRSLNDGANYSRARHPKLVITEDFLPHSPGTVLEYDLIVSHSGKAIVRNRLRSEQLPDQIIQMTEFRGPNGETAVGAPTTSRYRITEGYITIDNVPELRLGAAQGDVWHSEDDEQFLVKEFYADQDGNECVIVEKTFEVPSDNIAIKNNTIYQKGVGIITWEGLVSTLGSGDWVLVGRKTLRRNRQPHASGKMVQDHSATDFTAKPRFKDNSEAVLSLQDGPRPAEKFLKAYERSGSIPITTKNRDVESTPFVPLLDELLADFEKPYRLHMGSTKTNSNNNAPSKSRKLAIRFFEAEGKIVGAMLTLDEIDVESANDEIMCGFIEQINLLLPDYCISDIIKQNYFKLIVREQIVARCGVATLLIRHDTAYRYFDARIYF